MKVTISFKNIEHTNAIDEKIREKSEKLSKYLHGNCDIHWFCHIQDNLHYADIKLVGPTFTLNAEASSENLYKTLDLAINKLTKQLQKKKEKWKNHIHQGKNLEFEEEKNENEDESDNESYLSKIG